MLFGKVDEAEKRRRTMGSLAAVFEKSTRILTGKDVRTRVVEQPGTEHAAWTVQDGKHVDTIHFNLSQVGELETASDIVRVTGLNHHEGAHVWFTPHIPNSHRNPIRRVMDDLGENAVNAWNILEDQRIESMMVATYPSIRHYFSSMVAGYLLNGDDDDLKTAWVLVHGRRYLGSDLRDGLKEMFIAPEHTDRIAELIDDYRVLNLHLPGDQTKAARIIREFTKLLYEDLPQAPSYSHADCSTSSSGTPEDRQAAQNAVAKIRKGKDDRDNEEDDREASGGEGSDSKEDEEEESGQGKGGDDPDDDESDGEDDAGEDDGSEDEDDSDDESDSSNNSSPGGGDTAGTGNAPVDRSQSPIEKIGEALADLLDEAMNSESVRAEVKRAQEAIKGAGHNDSIGQHRGWAKDIRPDPQKAANAFAQRMERIKTDLDPGWETHEFTGRINVQRAMHGDPLGDVWDQWQEGKTDTTDIEMVVAADVSGSMSSHSRMLSDSVWALKRAADQMGIGCTVYAYDHDGYSVYKADDRAKIGEFPSMPADGGTQPKKVLIECARVLAQSQRSKKLFVVMTDGIWGDGYGGYYYSSTASGDDPMPDAKCRDIIAEMNGNKVLTAMAYLTGAYDTGRREIDWQNTQVHFKMADLSGFAPFADTLVRQLMKQ